MALRLREFGHKTIALRSLARGAHRWRCGGGSGLCGGGDMGARDPARADRDDQYRARLEHPIGGYLAVPSTGDRRSTISGFGGNLTIAQLIFLMMVRVQDLLIGANLGAAAVGTYRIAWRSNEIFANGAIQPFASVGLQTYSRLQRDPDGLRQAYQLDARASAPQSPFRRWSASACSRACGRAAGLRREMGEAGASSAGLRGDRAALHAQLFRFAVLTAMGNSRRQRTLAVVQLVSTVLLTWLALALRPDGGRDRLCRAHPI